MSDETMRGGVTLSFQVLSNFYHDLTELGLSQEGIEEAFTIYWCNIVEQDKFLSQLRKMMEAGRKQAEGS